jgi:uncharacterized protein (TIGR00251 family)
MDDIDQYATAVSEHADGVVLAVHAQPGGRSNAIRGVHDAAVKISVTQVAEKGKANKALIALLSRTLGVSKSQVTLLSGDTSSRKRFLIAGTTRDDVVRRLSAGK